MNTEFEVPEISGDSQRISGKLFPNAQPVEHDHDYENFKASQAIEGLPAGELADKMEAYEKLYTEWNADGLSDVLIDPKPSFGARLYFLISGRLRLSRYSIIQIAADPLRIFRTQIKELALAYAKELNNRKAVEIQASIGQAHIKNQALHAEFRKFLQEHFEMDLGVGTARDLTLYDIARDIMLRQK